MDLDFYHTTNLLYGYTMKLSFSITSKKYINTGIMSVGKNEKNMS